MNLFTFEKPAFELFTFYFRINQLLINSQLENFQFSMVGKISMDLKEFKEITPFNTKKYHADMIKVKPKETRQLEDSNQILEFYVKLYEFYSNVCDALLVFNDGFGFIALVRDLADL